VSDADTREKSYLIDSSVYFFRYYFSIRDSHLSKSGREVASVLAFTRWLIKFIEEHKPDYIACCFDESLGIGYRHEIDEYYKQNRALPDEALAYELLACKKMVELMGIPVYASEKYEADDLIAALAKASRTGGIDPVVVSRDKDLAQVLQPQSGLFWDYGHRDAENFHQFSEHFGVAPNRLADYLALVGDAVDNIFGVPGVGKKTGTALFKQFESWDDIKNNLDQLAGLSIRGGKTLGQKLVEHSELVDHNLKLTRLYENCLDGSVVSLERNETDLEQLISLLEEYNAQSSLHKQVLRCLS